MNRSRFPISNDPSFIAARRTAAVARATSASVILLGILVVAAMTACSPGMTSPHAKEPVSAAPAQSKDPASAARSIEQMHLDPAELREYTMNVHG